MRKITGLALFWSSTAVLRSSEGKKIWRKQHRAGYQTLVLPAMHIQISTFKYSATIISPVVSWRLGKGLLFVPDVT